jgi:hypothetical protein
MVVSLAKIVLRVCVCANLVTKNGTCGFRWRRCGIRMLELSGVDSHAIVDEGLRVCGNCTLDDGIIPVSLRGHLLRVDVPGSK